MSSIFDLFRKIETEKAPPAPVTHIVAGLGNYGREYEGTRPNAGFSAIDILSDRKKLSVTRAKFDALTDETVINGKRILVMKPQLYMNLSGVSVKKAADFYKIPAGNIIVICDDINLDVGKLRIRRKGSDGGQKGLRNIAEHLGTDAFPRIRVGVGKVPVGGDVVSWVLGRLPADERDTFRHALEKVPDIIPLIIDGNIEKAMCDYN